MADGSVTIEAELTDKEIEKGINEIKADLNELEKASSSVSEKMAKHFESFGNTASKAGKALTLGLTTPLIALGTAGVKYNAQMEDVEANLTTLLGSADKAKDMLADLKEMANTTPFETSDLLEATQMMLGFGLAADKTQGYLQTLGDISMGNSQKLMSLTRAFSQIGAAGKATMEDINQMIDAGFNPLQIMSEKTGKSMAELREEVSDGAISFEDIADAMETATSEGGRYYKAMEKASKTMNGKLSTALDALKTALGKLTQKLLPIVTKVVEKITDWANAFADLDDSTQETILTIAGIAAVAGPLLTIVGKLSTGIGTFAQALGVARGTITSTSSTVNGLSSVLKGLVSPAGIVTATLAAVAVGVELINQKIQKELESTKQLIEEINAETEARRNALDAIEKQRNASLAEIDNVQRLKNELTTLVDANGKVKEGYEARAQFILNEMNNALGTEYALNGNIIDSYSDMCASIDELILKKKAQIILEASEDEYREAIQNKTKAMENYLDTQDELSEATAEYNKLLEDRSKGWIGSEYSLVEGSLRLKEYGEKIKELNSSLGEQEQLLVDYNNNIASYEEKSQLMLEGGIENYKKIEASVGKTQATITQNANEELNKRIQNQIAANNQMQGLYDLEVQMNQNAQDSIYATNLEEGKKQLDLLAEELVARTSTVENLGISEVSAWKILAQNSYDTYEQTLSKMPVELQEQIQKMTGVLISDTTVTNAVGEMAEEGKTEFYNKVDGRTWGEDLTGEISGGMTSSSSRSRITSAGATVAGWISALLHFSLPEKGPLSDMDESMPDMIDLMAHGIDSNKKRLILSVNKLAKEMRGSLYDKMQSAVNFETQRLSANLTSQQLIVTQLEDNRQATLQSIDDNKEIVVNTTTKLDSKVIARETKKVNARRSLQYGY